MYHSATVQESPIIILAHTLISTTNYIQMKKKLQKLKNLTSLEYEGKNIYRTKSISFVDGSEDVGVKCLILDTQKNFEIPNLPISPLFSNLHIISF